MSDRLDPTHRRAVELAQVCAQPLLAHRLRLHSLPRHHADPAGRRCSSGWPVKPKAACPSAWAATSRSWSPRNSKPRWRAIPQLDLRALCGAPRQGAASSGGDRLPRRHARWRPRAPRCREACAFPVRSAVAVAVRRSGGPWRGPAIARGPRDRRRSAARWRRQMRPRIAVWPSAARPGDGADRAQRRSRGGGVGAAADRIAAASPRRSARRSRSACCCC